MKTLFITLILTLIFPAKPHGQTDFFLPQFVSYIPYTNLGVRDVHTDCTGNVVYVGGTGSSSYVCTPGTVNSAYLGGSSDAFVVKVDTNGSVVWSTLLGGSLYDRAYSVEIDSAGFIYVAGRAGPGLQTTVCALQTDFIGDNNPNPAYGIQDGFVTKLTPDGRSIVWSTYIGCDGMGFVRDIDLDAEGNVWAAMSVVSPQFPYITPGAVQTTATYPLNAALVKLSGDGSKLLFGTFLADGEHEGGRTTVRTDQHNNVFFLSHASGNNIPVTPGTFQQSVAGGDDFVISKFDASGNLIFCSYLGGSGNEEVETHSLEVDSKGNVIVAAYTYSSDDYPVTDSAFQKTYLGDREGVITSIASDGSRILASTFLGGHLLDEIEGIGIDAEDNIYVSGSTTSPDFPVTVSSAFQSVHGGGRDGYIAVLTPDLSHLQYATFAGGSAGDLLRSCHVDEWGRVHAGGSSGSADFPVYNSFFPSLTGSNTGIAVALSQMSTNIFSPGCHLNNSFDDPCFLSGQSELVTDESLVFPNPASNSFSLQMTTGMDVIRIELIDLNGHLQLSEMVEYAGQEINVSHVSRGMYFVRGLTKQNVVCGKILLQ